MAFQGLFSSAANFALVSKKRAEIKAANTAKNAAAAASGVPAGPDQPLPSYSTDARAYDTAMQSMDDRRNMLIMQREASQQYRNNNGG